MARERLGLAVIPGTGWSARDIQDVAREADAAGFDAIFSTEVNNDALATAQLMGSATERIQVGTWIANIYLRHSYVCAQGARTLRLAEKGRPLVNTLGDSYGFIFNDPELRRGMIREAERTGRSHGTAKTRRIVRCWVAARLHALAVLIEPSVHSASAREGVVLPLQLAGRVSE